MNALYCYNLTNKKDKIFVLEYVFQGDGDPVNCYNLTDEKGEFLMVMLHSHVIKLGTCVDASGDGSFGELVVDLLWKISVGRRILEAANMLAGKVQVKGCKNGIRKYFKVTPCTATI